MEINSSNWLLRLLTKFILISFLSLPAIAQNECRTTGVGDSQVLQFTTDIIGVQHQTECWSPSLRQTYYPLGSFSGLSVAFSSITSGINTTATMQLSNIASLSPLDIGQTISNQAWLQPGLSAPTSTGTLTGGTISNSHGWLIQYTFNTALGETLPSVLLSGSTNTLSGGVCNSGSSCTLTIVAPTLPSGYTSWNAYVCDTSAGLACGSGPALKLAACTALSAGVNCTMTAVQGSGSALPIINTAIIAPPNVQATNGPPGWEPIWYFPKADGNYYPWLGIEWASCDATNGPAGPCGTPMFTHRTYFSDQGQAPYSQATVGGKNCFVCIDHQSGIGTVLTNQDRALWINHSNPASDTLQHYSITGLQVETDVRGAPTWQGAIDGETVAGSFQLEDDTTNAPGVPNGGNQVIRASYFARPTGNGLTTMVGVKSTMSTFRPSGSWPAGATQIAFDASWGSGGSSSTNLQGYGYKCTMPTTVNKYGALNVCFYIPNAAMTVGASDFLIRNDFATLPSLLNGTVAMSGINNSAPSAAMTVNAALNVQSSATIIQGTIAQPASVSCSGGGSSYSYEFVGVDSNGGTVASTAGNSASTCTNPLTSGNPATINTTNNAASIAQYAGFVRIDVYRTAGPMATGKIGSLTCVAPAGSLGPNCNAFSDTGLAATTAVPTINTTGTLNIGGDFTLGTSKGQHFNTQAANNDFAGTCTAAAATTCTVTFTRAYTSAPICTATDATNIIALKVTPSTTSLIITTTGASSDTFDYNCVGNPN